MEKRIGTRFSKPSGPGLSRPNGNGELRSGKGAGEQEASGRVGEEQGRGRQRRGKGTTRGGRVCMVGAGTRDVFVMSSWVRTSEWEARAMAIIIINDASMAIA
uniref:Uncharacterized protein n=1 Tax=Oryza rufipogon TaxID=4529 RepID=A0A0E0RDZ2_ORYRU